MMLKILFILLIIGCSIESYWSFSEDDFFDMMADYSDNENELYESIQKYNYLATRTPYRFVNPTHHDLYHFKSQAPHFSHDIPHLGHSLKQVDLGYNTSEFHPVRAWALIRHGTNFMNKNFFDKYQNLTQFRDDIMRNKHKLQLDKDKIEELEDWDPNLIESVYERYLANEGVLEMIELGKRMQNLFPTLFDEKKPLRAYHTPTERAESSAVRFIEGLDYLMNSDHVRKVLKDDPVLRPYMVCSRWRKDVKMNPDALREVNYFKEKTLVSDFVDDFKKKLNVDYINLEMIQNVYTVCAYETAWRMMMNISPWCYLFDERGLKIMEYVQDLQHFWLDGYGYEITTKLACTTAADLFKQLEQPTTEHDVNLLFTDSSTLLKFYAFLGLYKDDFYLTNNDFEKHRVWKTSNICPFGANLFFILLESKDHGKYVLTLHNENPIRIPNCNYEKFNLCRFEEFKAIYKQQIEWCNLDNICENKVEL